MGVFRKFPRTFWVANTIELFERWACMVSSCFLPITSRDHPIWVVWNSRKVKKES